MGLSISLSDFISEPFEGAPYDRIYSIGSLEHVRPAELTSLYQKTYDALAPGGLAVHQFFSYRSDPYPISVAVLELFFPGSMLSMHRLHIEAAEAAELRINHDPSTITSQLSRHGMNVWWRTGTMLWLW